MEAFNNGRSINQVTPTKDTNQMGIEGGVDFHARFPVHVSSALHHSPCNQHNQHAILVMYSYTKVVVEKFKNSSTEMGS